LAKLEENILRMQPISDAVEHLSASDIVEALLDGIGVGDFNNSVS
jgi:molecular chaperone Hsp33